MRCDQTKTQPHRSHQTRNKTDATGGTNGLSTYLHGNQLWVSRTDLANDSCFAWISMTKEWRLDQPLSGVFGLIVAALCLCAFIVLVAAYVQKTRSLLTISHSVELVTSNGEFR